MPLPTNRPANISDQDIAWLAGLLEGEGYFAMSPNMVRGVKRHYPTITLAMSDRDVVKRCADLWGTKVSLLKSRKEHHKPTYRCLIRGTGAVQWMVQVYPYMGERRRDKVFKIISAWTESPQVSRQVRQKREISVGFAAGLKPFSMEH